MRTALANALRLLAGCVASVAAGCSPASQQPLGPLPLHRLSIPHREAGSGVAAAAQGAAWQQRSSPAEESHRWKYIVIHHSATDTGSAEIFDRSHRSRGWDELGYHFVITNGRGGSDGAIQVGGRWVAQKHGAHCGGTPDNEYNIRGIGICLVGDFTHSMPSPAQLASLKGLLLHLMRTQAIAGENIIGHHDAPCASTACPGRRFQAYVNGDLRLELAAELAATGGGAKSIERPAPERAVR